MVGYVKCVLGDHFGRGRARTVNIRGATRGLSAYREETNEWEADRQLLGRLVVRRWSTGQRLTESIVNRLATMLQRVEPRAVLHIRRIVVSSEAQKVGSGRKLSDDLTWADRPDPVELAHLRDILDQLAAEEKKDDDKIPGPNQLVVSMLDRFRKWAKKKGHEDWRIDLAEAEILAPLSRHGRTGGIERGWHELSDAQKFEVVRGGIRVQRVMLNRPPTAERARESYPPGDYQDLLDATGEEGLIWPATPDATHQKGRRRMRDRRH